jgi:hypothetical protein
MVIGPSAVWNRTTPEASSMNVVHGLHKNHRTDACKKRAIVLRMRTFEAAPAFGDRAVLLRAGAAVGGFRRLAA